MKQIFYLLSLFISLTINGQEQESILISDKTYVLSPSNDSLKDVISTDINLQNTALIEKDWDKFVSYLPNFFLDIISKEKIIESYELIESWGMSLHPENIRVNKISKIISHESDRFCMVIYGYSASLKLKEMAKGSKDMIVNSYTSMLGEGNIRYDEKESILYMNAKNQIMWAISHDKGNSWKYFGDKDYKKDEGMRSSFKRLLKIMEK